MNILQRWFNRAFPTESSADRRPGALGIHFSFPWMKKAAEIHDIRDEMIAQGELECSYEENDEDLQHLFRKAQENTSWLNNAQKRGNLIVRQLSRPVVRLYRIMRGQE